MRRDLSSLLKQIQPILKAVTARDLRSFPSLLVKLETLNDQLHKVKTIRVKAKKPLSAEDQERAIDIARQAAHTPDSMKIAMQNRPRPVPENVTPPSQPTTPASPKPGPQFLTPTPSAVAQVAPAAKTPPPPVDPEQAATDPLKSPEEIIRRQPVSNDPMVEWAKDPARGRREGETGRYEEDPQRSKKDPNPYPFPQVTEPGPYDPYKHVLASDEPFSREVLDHLGTTIMRDPAVGKQHLIAAISKWSPPVDPHVREWYLQMAEKAHPSAGSLGRIRDMVIGEHRKQKGIQMGEVPVAPKVGTPPTSVKSVQEGPQRPSARDLAQPTAASRTTHIANPNQIFDHNDLKEITGRMRGKGLQSVKWYLSNVINKASHWPSEHKQDMLAKLNQIQDPRHLGAWLKTANQLHASLRTKSARPVSQEPAEPKTAKKAG